MRRRALPTAALAVAVAAATLAACLASAPPRGPRSTSAARAEPKPPLVVSIAADSTDLAPATAAAIAGLRRVGVAVRGAADGPRSGARVVTVRLGCSPDCERWAGIWRAGERTVYVDTRCLARFQLAILVAHELLHAVGCKHVCREGDDDWRYGCSPVGRAPGHLLNPSIPVPAPAEGELTPPRLGPLDLAELRRVGALPPLRVGLRGQRRR